MSIYDFNYMIFLIKFNHPMYFFNTKRVNHCEGYVHFLGTEYQPQINILNHFLHYKFLQRFHQIQKYPLLN